MVGCEEGGVLGGYGGEGDHGFGGFLVGMVRACDGVRRVEVEFKSLFCGKDSRF